MHHVCMYSSLAEEGGHAHVHAAYFKNISRELIGYNTKIWTDGVEWGRVNIWLVIRISKQKTTGYF